MPWWVVILLSQSELAYTFYLLYFQCHKISLRVPLVWSLHQSHFLWNIFILLITTSSLMNMIKFTFSRLLWLCIWSLSNGSSSTALSTFPRLGGLPRPSNAASPKALHPAQGSPHPIAHSHRGRDTDLSPNSGQHWRFILSLEPSAGSAEASSDTVFPNKFLACLSLSQRLLPKELNLWQGWQRFVSAT